VRSWPAVSILLTGPIASEPTARVCLCAGPNRYQRLMLLFVAAVSGDADDGAAEAAPVNLLLDKTDGLILLDGRARVGRAAPPASRAAWPIPHANCRLWPSAYPGPCYVEITRTGPPDERHGKAGLIDSAPMIGGLPLGRDP